MADDPTPPKRTAKTLSGESVDSELPAGWGQPAPSRVGRVGQWGSAGNSSRTAGGGGPRVATFNSLNGEDSPKDDDNKGNELFAGGEKSALAIQNPDDARGSQGRGAGGSHRTVVEDILQQAMNAGPPVDPNASAPPRNPWAGAGHTLGSEESPSIPVGDVLRARQPVPGAFGEDDDDEPEEETQQRRLIFWRDGFSIEDGELYRYDAPGNQELLAAIHAGRAPVSLFNVRYNQPLQLLVEQRTNEDFKAPPKQPAKPFSGGGNRLGSAAPTVSGSSTPTMPGGLAGPRPTTPAAAPSASVLAAPSAVEIDESKPTTNIQVRLGDGTRLVARLNLDQTVADVRAFVAAARPDSRPFVLQTTFPSRELSDNETVQEAKLANAVVVQRFI